MFSVQVAADIFSNKINYELTFPTRPSTQELIRVVESTFTNTINSQLPDGVSPHSFHVAKLKAFDDNRDRWVDLISDAQLIDFCQVYAFQPENPWHKESQKAIPPAVKPPTPLAARLPQQQQQTIIQSTPRSAARSDAAYTTSQQTISSSNVVTSSGGVQQYQHQTSSSSSRAHNNNNNAVSNTALVAISSSSTGHYATTTTARPSVDASFDEKVRVVFNEFDIKGHRILEMDDLRQGFRALGFEFTHATMNDLFQKGDLNNDGRITHSEFERFAKLYPIMTDCLFYRSKAFWDEDNLAREVLSDKEAARVASSVVIQVETEHTAARRAVDDATRDVENAASDMQGLSNRLKDVRKSMDAAHRNKEKASKEKSDRESELVAIRDRERQARQSQAEAAREAEKIDRKVVLCVQEASKADDKVKQLEAALVEARRSAERAQQATRQAQVEADQAKGREREMAKQADIIIRDLPAVENAVRAAEQNLQHTHDNIRDLDGLASDIARDTDEAARRRDNASRLADQARGTEGRLADDLERARRTSTEKELQAKQREEEFLEAQRQRQQVTPNERALVEQELRLREQRDTLEQKEGKLKNEAGVFLAGLRSSLQTQNRAFSRDPSVNTYTNDYRRGASGY